MRGSSYFIKNIPKNCSDDDIADLTKLSNTFFRMSHEILFIWGTKYLPNSQFSKFYSKLSKYCTFPEYHSDFKFFNLPAVEKSTFAMKKVNSIFQ